MAGGAACLLAATSPFVRPVRSDPDDRVVKLKAIDPRAVSSVPTSAPLVALTFDDGPDPAYTPRVLEILAQHQVRATFFMIGRSAARHPELVAAVLTAGHTIANHTQDHLWLDRLDAADVQSQVEECRQTFDRLDVPANALFRPPRGLTSPTVASVTATLHERSYFWGTCLEANLSHHDVDTSAALCAERTHPGAIVLAHDGGHLEGPNPQSIDRSGTVAALPALISLIRARGLEFATLPTMLPARRAG